MPNLAGSSIKKNTSRTDISMIDPKITLYVGPRNLEGVLLASTLSGHWWPASLALAMVYGFKGIQKSLQNKIWLQGGSWEIIMNE